MCGTDQDQWAWPPVCKEAGPQAHERVVATDNDHAGRQWCVPHHAAIGGTDEKRLAFATAMENRMEHIIKQKHGGELLFCEHVPIKSSPSDIHKPPLCR